MHCHTENRQVLMQKNESGLLNSVGSKMNCSQIHSTGDGTTAAEQVCFIDGLSVLSCFID